MDEQPRDPAPQPEQPESASIPPGPEPEPSGWIPPAESKSNRIVIRVVAGIAVAVAATLLPARSASRADPSALLRQ